ncbi:MAG TPA: GntR family transcriptional regulator [Candidatus Limnocylindrales bacterium]|nr:GntR family transcriptional regulator [Candidatus Limnocylindrales bacterium]
MVHRNDNGVGDDADGRPSAAARAYAVLKERILECEYPPGMSLNEGRLAESLELSKTPIREALAMLTHEGFVQVLPRQGYRVTDITIVDVQEIFNMRLLLEPAAAAMAAEHATAAQLQALRHLAEDGADDLGDDRAFIAQNRAFHVMLAAASGNARLASTLTHLLEEMQRLYLSGLDLRNGVEQQRGEHRDLVAALLKGNHHLAHDIAVRQIESSRERIMESLLAAMSSTGPAGVKLGVEVRRQTR